MELGIGGLRVLVTAGASGIGLEIARTFHREGARIHICDLDADRLDEVAASLAGVTFSCADVGDRESVAALFQEVEATH